jgi:hypothetical protein
VNAEIVAAIDELVGALAKFSERVGRDVELIVDAGGTLTVMVVEEFTGGVEPGAFEQAGVFESVGSLWAYLELGEL